MQDRVPSSILDGFRPNVLVTSHYDRDVVAAPLRELAVWADVVDARRGRCLTEDELLKAVPGMHAVIASDERYSATVLQRAEDLAVIARDGTGYDAIDLSAANDRGILVTRSPVLHAATANTTIGLMIGLVRKIAQADRDIREGRWHQRERWLAPDLTGMTLGIVGFGRVGQEVARRALAMDMTVVVCNRSDATDTASKMGAKATSLEDLLDQADIVSSHLRHTESTDKFFDAARFGAMKRGAYFVNTARGGLVDEAALAEALACGHLAGAALDVFVREPAEPGHRLLGFDNVLCTPHFAGDTTTTMALAVTTAVQQIADCLAGRRPGHLVNPQAWDHARVGKITKRFS